MSAGHTPGPWSVKIEGTMTGAWATVYQECVDPNTGEDWDRELFRSDIAHVRKQSTYQMQSGWGELHETPDQWELTDDGSEHLANARLIAAVPDLLAACEAALPWLGGLANENPSVAPEYEQLRAAIAKAAAP